MRILGAPQGHQPHQAAQPQLCSCFESSTVFCCFFVGYAFMLSCFPHVSMNHTHCGNFHDQDLSRCICALNLSFDATGYASISVIAKVDSLWLMKFKSWERYHCCKGKTPNTLCHTTAIRRTAILLPLPPPLSPFCDTYFSAFGTFGSRRENWIYRQHTSHRQ